MGSLLLEIVWKVGGTPTDVTSVALSDSTASFGVKRADTGEVLVAAGTAMTRTSAGVYQYTLTTPADGLTYNWVAKITDTDGAVYYAQRTSVDAVTVTSVSGTYGTQTDIENYFGTNNVALYSNLDGGTTDDLVRVQAASNYADAEINGFFQDGPFSVPLAFTSNSARVTATHWYAVIAGTYLYRSRGDLRDESDTTGSKFRKQLAEVYEDMARYKSGIKRLLAARRWPTPTAPVGGTWAGN